MIFYDEALERYHAYGEYTLVQEGIYQARTGPIWRRIYRVDLYNCYGRKIHVATFPAWGEETFPVGVAVDLRSLHAMQLGCCPPIFEGEIEGYGEIGKEGFDAVEEAAKLHKRGYLGGVYQAI